MFFPVFDGVLSQEGGDVAMTSLCFSCGIRQKRDEKRQKLILQTVQLTLNFTVDQTRVYTFLKPFGLFYGWVGLLGGVFLVRGDISR